MFKDKLIFAVIPAYNEAGRIKKVIGKTYDFVNQVIVVNDCSTDKTLDVIKHTKACLINLEKNSGAGFATRIGCDLAIEKGADIIITIDADGQHCPEDIPRLINELISKNCDIVFGYREKTKAMPRFKKIGNNFLIFLCKILFNVKVQDALTGFHAFTKQAYPKIRWESDRFGFILEYIYSIYKHNLNYSETKVKTIYFNKEHGMKTKDGIKAIVLLFIWKFKMPKSFIKFLKLK